MRIQISNFFTIFYKIKENYLKANYICRSSERKKKAKTQKLQPNDIIFVKKQFFKLLCDRIDF